jgi:hypothetical protein
LPGESRCARRGAGCLLTACPSSIVSFMAVIGIAGYVATIKYLNRT